MCFRPTLYTLIGLQNILIKNILKNNTLLSAPHSAEGFYRGIGKLPTLFSTVEEIYVIQVLIKLLGRMTFYVSYKVYIPI